MKTEQEQNEEIRNFIVALSITDKDTFKYKGSTYKKEATTASTLAAPSVRKSTNSSLFVLKHLKN